MGYSVIQPPFSLEFREMSRQDLLAYRDWYHSVMPERTTELARAVASTPGFERWNPDLTPDSLGPLGEWFAGQVERRKRTEAEMDEIKGRLAFPIEVSDEELTNRTISLAMDIGMYFGQVVVKCLPGAKWAQRLRGKSCSDYGRPAIVGRGNVPLEPVRIAVTLAYALADKTRSGNRLRELFDIWSKTLT